MNYEKYVKVCKRVNNTKRNYLVLNEAQCKHVPSKPARALKMFDDLAELVKDYKNEQRLLVVGFAETATAIGVEVAIQLNCDYVNTTRESFEAEFFNFTESHSHATEQKLIKVDLNYYNHILFVEDEVTTGNTILNIIRKLSEVNKNIKFSVASILNGMSKENFDKYEELGIDVHYLVKLDNSGFADEADKYQLNGDIYDMHNTEADTKMYFKLANTRKVTDTAKYNKDLEEICSNLACKDGVETVLVLGTEECMYPAIKIGAYLEGLGFDVRSHSTTRSPIGVVSSSAYPLYTQLCLSSVYNQNRDTYLYNLRNYDAVYIISDTSFHNKGMSELILALRMFGNKNITEILLEEK